MSYLLLVLKNMIKKLLKNLNKRNMNEEIDYICGLTGTWGLLTAEILFVKILNKTSIDGINYGGISEFTISSSDKSFYILFSDPKRLEMFNRINQLLNELVGYKIEYIGNKNDKILVSKISNKYFYH